MIDVIPFDPERHLPSWTTFIQSSYRNPNYILLCPEFLRWQFLDNPANKTGAYTLWLVLRSNVVIAQLGFVPFRGIAPNGETFEGAYPMNLMVLPEFRALGLGAILLDRLLKQTPCVLNPGSSEAGATLCMGLGMHDLGCLRRYIAVTDEKGAMTLATDGHLPAGIRQADPTGTGADTGVVARLPEGAPPTFSFPVRAYGAERSRGFLRWRYESHPRIKYEFLLSAELQSVLVFHEERESGTNTPVIRIVDFLGEPEDQDVLLDRLLRTARSRNAAIVDFFSSLNCYDSTLKRAGFFEEADHGGARIAALFQPLDFRKTGIRVLASHPAGGQIVAQEWYVVKGDSDQDRPNDARLKHPSRA